MKAGTDKENAACHEKSSSTANIPVEDLLNASSTPPIDLSSRHKSASCKPSSEDDNLSINTPSNIARIPVEALSSLANPVDSISLGNFHSLTSMGTGTESGNPSVDPALIPRWDILRNIVHLICPPQGIHRKETNNTKLTLRGMGGLGKTVLAAITVSMIEIRSTFDHILWLNLGNYFKEGSRKNNLDYDMYIDCLKRLCKQLGVPSNKFNCDVFVQSGDSKLKKSAKVVQAMEKAKLEMSVIFAGLKILLVLDDVWSHEDVEMFNFDGPATPLFSILLTTRIFDGEPSAGSYSIDVELLSQTEANHLFSIEAGLEGVLSTEDTEAIDLILEKTGYLLPLAVRSAGRYVKTCRTLRADTSLSQIADVLTRATNSSRMSPLIEILDCSFSFVTDETTAFAFKLFFSAFAVLFCREDILRPWVPWHAVKLLWKALRFNKDMKDIDTALCKYKLAKLEQIADLMCVMG
eukprot:CAMPEP_0194320092 /NCGR_PEP_ID=MMETSP0171-20130528/16477_1 /TAXON_ID=218684 /ORGANISM="Corethron pennatum, Strain L29A3" /LENGTH=464 /DNA_ID=CAMNT_0039077537 /DNA_START=301 /DNA_END=1691 /DNA_ORIENTATION=+